MKKPIIEWFKLLPDEIAQRAIINATKNFNEEGFAVGILENGTTSGRTSVMIILKNPDGTFTIGQCTAREFEAIGAALKGAKERFGDKDPINPLNN